MKIITLFCLCFALLNTNTIAKPTETNLGQSQKHYASLNHIFKRTEAEEEVQGQNIDNEKQVEKVKIGDDPCCICLNELSESDRPNLTSCKRRCGKWMHTACLNPWLNARNNCPLCNVVWEVEEELLDWNRVSRRPRVPYASPIFREISLNQGNEDSVMDDAPLTRSALSALYGLGTLSDAEYETYFNSFCDGQARRVFNSPADIVRQTFPWRDHFQEFLNTEYAQNIPVVNEYFRLIAQRENDGGGQA